MGEKRFLGYINSNEEFEVVYVPLGNVKKIYARKKFDKEKWAKEIYNKYAKNIIVFVRPLERCVVCMHRKSHKVGYSFCRPTDKFNEKVGIAIAICRAFSLDIPDEIFKD